jgi:RNA polymerase sigma-70 factor (ECF subfamily)
LADTVTQADQQDIAASLNGDGEAYARLVRRYQNEIAARMRRFSRDAAVLEELVQDVFVEAYLSLASFRGQAPFLHWLGKVATRTGYRFWKTRDRRALHEEPLTETVLELAGDPQAQPPSEAAETLYRLLERLPPADRLVLTLFYFDECDIREIAERAGWTRTGTKVRLHRARRKLEKILHEAGIRRTEDVTLA